MKDKGAEKIYQLLSFICESVVEKTDKQADW
jgi:hypothetical protein